VTTRALAIMLALAGCGADGTLKTPEQMTPAERCANAQGTLLAMKVGGAWPSSIAEGEKTVAEICRQRPAAVGDTP
jgi:predicted small lipoprotein YifL